MNAAHAKLFLPLITALAQGKTIQLNTETLNNPDWENIPSPAFDFPVEYYRVKPEPVIKEGFFVVWDDGMVSARFSKLEYALAVADARPTAAHKVTHIGHLVITDGVPSMTFSEYVPPTT